MVNYKNAKIYKIVFPNGEEFIGTTTKQYLSQRKTQINYNYKKFLAKEVDDKCSPTLNRFHILMNQYGADSYKIILISCVECKNKDELNSWKSEY